MDVRKSFTDAGYLAVGLGVMGFQRAQVRRRQLQEHVQSAGSCVATKAGELQDRVGAHGRNLDSKAREARGVAEGTVNQTVSRVQERCVRTTSMAPSRRATGAAAPRAGLRCVRTSMAPSLRATRAAAPRTGLRCVRTSGD